MFLLESKFRFQEKNFNLNRDSNLGSPVESVWHLSFQKTFEHELEWELG
jgi:hypothetical protein